MKIIFIDYMLQILFQQKNLTEQNDKKNLEVNNIASYYNNGIERITK